MKTSKSAGIDKISIRLMQGAGSTILDPLHYIFNLSLNTGVFPNDWKIARVLQSINMRIKQIVVTINPFQLYLM